MFNIDTAVNILAGFDDSAEVDNAYVVDVSNPVCPHCGAKLVINDDTTAAENNILATDQIQESWVSGDDIIPLVKETAEDICEVYFQDEEANPEELIYVTDPKIKSVIHRKAIELSSILKNSYDVQISVELIETHIKKELRYIVGNYK